MAREKMSTEERLEIVERKLYSARRWNRVLLVAAVVIVGGLLLSWIRPRPALARDAAGKVIRANKFVLEDRSGRTRAKLTLAKGVPALVLLDENGKPRAGLAVLKDGPGVVLYDKNTTVRALMGLAEDGPGIRLIDENGKTLWKAT